MSYGKAADKKCSREKEIGKGERGGFCGLFLNGMDPKGAQGALSLSLLP